MSINKKLSLLLVLSFVMSALPINVNTLGAYTPITPATTTQSTTGRALTVRTIGGIGQVSIDYGTYGSTRTERIEPGTRVTISARPYRWDRDAFFDRWTYSFGETTNHRRPQTTFIMPDRDVTVTANFGRDLYWWWGPDGWDRPNDWRWWDDRDWWDDRYRWDDWYRWDRWDDWRWHGSWNHAGNWWGHTNWMVDPQANLPQQTVQPAVGVAAQNNVVVDAIIVTIPMPGTLDGLYHISIGGMPFGVTAPSYTWLTNGQLQIQFSGMSRAARGSHQLTITLHDTNGNQVTVPTLFTLDV